MKQLNLIFLRDERVLLSNKPYTSWREIQDEYPEYMTSIEFSSIEHIEEYIMEDYNYSLEKVRKILHVFNTSDSNTVEIKF